MDIPKKSLGRPRISDDQPLYGKQRNDARKALMAAAQSRALKPAPVRDMMAPTPPARLPYRASKILLGHVNPRTLRVYEDLNNNSLRSAATAKTSPSFIPDYDEMQYPLPSQVGIAISTCGEIPVYEVFLVPETANRIDARRRLFLQRVFEAITSAGASLQSDGLRQGTGMISATLTVPTTDPAAPLEKTNEEAALQLHMAHYALTRLQVEAQSVERFEAHFVHQQDSDLNLIATYRVSRINRPSEVLRTHVAALEDYMVWSECRRKSGHYCSSIKALAESDEDFRLHTDLAAFRIDLEKQQASSDALYRRKTGDNIRSAFVSLKNLRAKRVAEVGPQDALLLNSVLAAYGLRNHSSLASLGPYIDVLHTVAASLHRQENAPNVARSLRDLSRTAVMNPTCREVKAERTRVESPGISAEDFIKLLAVIDAYYASIP
jgi:hypothetical protein